MVKCILLNLIGVGACGSVVERIPDLPAEQAEIFGRVVQW